MQPRCTKTLSFSPDIFVCMTWIELLNLILLKIFYELLLNFCCSHWRETMIDNLFPSTNPINLVPENANCSSFESFRYSVGDCKLLGGWWEEVNVLIFIYFLLSSSEKFVVNGSHHVKKYSLIQINDNNFNGWFCSHLFYIIS